MLHSLTLFRLGNPYSEKGADQDRRVTEKLSPPGLPETLNFDRIGGIAYLHTGALDGAANDGTLLPLLS